MNGLKLHIEHEGNLSFLELDEIRTIIDLYVLKKIAPELTDPQLMLDLNNVMESEDPAKIVHHAPFSFLEIAEIRAGSIVLGVVGATCTFALGYLLKGARRGLLPSELDRMGKIVSDILGTGVSEINDNLEQWVQQNLKKRRRRVKIAAQVIKEHEVKQNYDNL